MFWRYVVLYAYSVYICRSSFVLAINSQFCTFSFTPYSIYQQHTLHCTLRLMCQRLHFYFQLWHGKWVKHGCYWCGGAGGHYLFTDILFLCLAHRGPGHIPDQKTTVHTPHFGLPTRNWMPSVCGYNCSPVPMKFPGWSYAVCDGLLLHLAHEVSEMHRLGPVNSSDRSPWRLAAWEGCNSSL